MPSRKPSSVLLGDPSFNTVIGKQSTFAEAIKAGTLKLTGDARTLDTLMSIMDTFSGTFEIVEPIRH